MPRAFLLLAVAASLLASACSEAQSEDQSQGQGGKKKKDKDKKESPENRLADAAVPGLRRVGTLQGVRESSSLALAGTPNTFFTQGDENNPPVLYKINAAGEVLDQITLPVQNHDWESLSRDTQGNLFVADVGNNASDRRDLVIYRVNPAAPRQVGRIQLSYPDQKEFPPAKKERNFDSEASVWHAGRVYLFTKDRAQGQTSKVYSVPDAPGQYTAKLVAQLPIPGQVTDATLSPNGRRLVLLAREEMFVLEGADFDSLLKATPRRIALDGAGQTEGAVFVDDNTLYISTEQGALYEYKL